VIDEDVPMEPRPNIGAFGLAYTQTSFVAKPENTLGRASRGNLMTCSSTPPEIL